MKQQFVNPVTLFQVYTVRVGNKIHLMEVRYRGEVLGGVNAQIRYDVLVDIGDAVEIEGNFIALRQGEQFQLYCHVDGKLNKGGKCTRYIISRVGFIYEGVADEWFRSEHDCTKIIALGTFYRGGVWVREEGKKAVVTYMFNNHWVSKTYQSFEVCDGGMVADYLLKIGKNYYDVIFKGCNDTIDLYHDVTEEDVTQLRNDPFAKVFNKEEKEKLMSVNFFELRGK